MSKCKAVLDSQKVLSLRLKSQKAKDAKKKPAKKD